MAIASVVQGLIETGDGKVFELDSSKGSAWVESVSSFRYVPTGANKPYTVRQETKKGGDYWYGYRKVAGKLHKKYIGKSSELSTVKLEEIAEALNALQQPRVTQVTDTVTQVTEFNNQRVTDRDTAERVTALEVQFQALQKSLEELRSVLLGKPEWLGNSPELPNHNVEVTDVELLNAIGNLPTDKTFTGPGMEDIEFLREQNEDLKRLLAQKNPLVSGNLWQEMDKLQERNRQLRLKMGEERRSSIEKISELEHQIEKMMRRNQEKQARLDLLEIQVEEVADSKLHNELHTELGNLKTDNENLRTDYAALLESSTAVTNKLRAEVQELRSQLDVEKKRVEEVWEELSDTEEALAEVRAENLELQKTCGELRSELVDREKDLAVALAEVLDLKQKIVAAGKDLPEAADLLNQLKAKRKKSKADLADLETILEILES